MLAGCVLGVAWLFANSLSVVTPAWLGYPEGGSIVSTSQGILGARFFLASLAGSVWASVLTALVLLVVFFLMKKFLRKDGIALGAVALIAASVLALSGAPWIVVLLVPTTLVILMGLLTRLGLLASTVSLFVIFALEQSPGTFDTSVWYFGTGLATCLLVVGLSLLGFRIAIGNQPLPGISAAED